MAISIENLKSQFLEFGEAVSHGREPLVSGSEGLAALRLVLGVYQSARERAPVYLL